MKLTNYIRDAFITSVLEDVPHIDYDQQIQDGILKAFVDALPPAARRLWDDPETRGYLNLERWRVNRKYQYVPAMQTDDSGVELPEATSAEVKRLMALQEAQSERFEALRAKLTSVVYGCTTRKQLAEALPEFEKYLPSESTKGSNLPAMANVVTEFVNAGWPAGKAA